MIRHVTHRALPKPFAVLMAVLMALYFVPFLAMPAQAADVGGFEIEGNLVDDTEADPPIDWFDLGPGSPGFNTGVDNTVGGQDDTTFQGSSKEFDESGSGAWPSWQFGTGNATGKSDFGRWATYDVVDDNDHVWFYFAFDRGFGTGTAKYAFELNQLTQSPTTDANPDRSQGDIRLVIYDQGNGIVTLEADAQNPDVGVYVWDDPDFAGTGAAGPDTDQDGEWVKSSDQSGIFSGSSNTGETPVTVPSWWTGGNTVNGTLTKDTFLEFGIDLTSFGAVLDCPSAGFTAVNARSITGTGGPGTLVDYIAAIPVTIPSSCALLVINKEDEAGNPLGGATFKIEPNPLPEGTPGRPDADFLTIFDDSDGNATVEGGTNYDDPDATAGRITLAAVVPDVDYTITEIASPPGYIGDSSEETVTPEPFSEDNAVTFTNLRQRGSLTISKSTTGGAGTFVFDVDCSDNAYDRTGTNPVTIQVGADATASVLVASNIPTGTTCTVTERSNPLFTKTVTVPANGTVVIDPNGETVSFTNARNLGRITVVKNITGTAAGASATFTFTVDCAGTAYDQTLKVTVSSGTSGSATTGLIPTGTACTVTEASSPDWKQESVVPAGGAVTVPGTVTFTNSPVVEVLPVKEAKPPKVLPHTGAGLPLGPLAATAVGLFGMGLLLMAAGRRRRQGSHRA